MKKFITAAAFLAASTALASAATTMLETNLSEGATEKSGGIASFGFSAQINSDWLTGWNSEYTGLVLDSVSITAASNSTLDSTGTKLVVASLSGSTPTFLAISEAATVPTTTGATITFSGFTTYDNSSITLTADTSYAFMFVTSPTELSASVGLEKGGFVYSTLAAYSNENAGTSSTSEGFITRSSNVYTYNAQSGYKAKVSISGTAIPEPSAFGLLAGAGALALVAARRRRSRKAA